MATCIVRGGHHKSLYGNIYTIIDMNFAVYI